MTETDVALKDLCPPDARDDPNNKFRSPRTFHECLVVGTVEGLLRVRVGSGGAKQEQGGRGLV